MGGSSKGGGMPKAPNYKKLMEKQNVLNKDASLYNTRLNSPDLFGPGGSVKWTDDGTGKFTGTLSFDPTHQSMYDKSGALVNRGLSDIENLGEWNPSETPEYDPNSGRMAADALYERVMSRLRPEQQRERDLMFTKYAQRGLHPGSEAFNYADENLSRAHGDVAERAALDAEIAGGSEARQNYASALMGQNQRYGQEAQNRSRPFDELSFMQGTHNKVSSPQLPAFGGASGYTPGNLTQAAQAGYENKMGQVSAGNQKKGNLANLGMNVFGAYKGGLFS